MKNDAAEIIAALPIWQGRHSFVPLSGGLTNHNFLVTDDTGRFVVRLGHDIAEHQVMRFNELAAGKAAHAAGISPRIVHAQEGVLVMDYIASKTLTPEDARDPVCLERIVELIRRCHVEVPKYLRGAALVFWVFHVIRDYGWTLREGGSSHLAILPDLQARADQLEQAVGPIDLVFGHNDLLAGNLLDDGKRMWLIDWDYAGFNSPLFDLGGLASNNEFDEAHEHRLLEAYFQTPLSDQLWHRYRAMKCASLLRETMWSMVSEIHSEIDFDFAPYTAENMSRFDAAMSEFQSM